MADTPKRRWFRFAFSLRTFFIAVTIFGVWLGWQLNWIRERREFLAAEEALFAAIESDYEIGTPCTPPWPLGLFGENGRFEIYLFVDGLDPERLTAGDLAKADKAKWLFPESHFGMSHESIDSDGERHTWTSFTMTISCEF